MNSNDETELEKLMKASMAEKQFTLKPEYWQAAQELIRQDRARKRRRAVLLWLPSSVFICTSLTMLWLYTHQPANTIGQKPLNTAQNQAEQAEKTKPSSTPAISAKEIKAPTASSSKQKEQESAYTNRPGKSVANAGIKAGQPGQVASAKTKLEVRKAASNDPLIGQMSPRNKNGTEPLAKTAIIDTNMSDKAIPAVENPQDLKTIAVKAEAPLTEKALEAANELQTTLPKDSLPPAEQALAAQPDTAQLSNTETDSNLTKSKDRLPPSRQKHWMISAGLSLYNPPVHLGSQPFNGLLQGTYFYPLHQNYSLFAGLGYLQVNQHFAPRTYRSVSYLFGENITETSINTYRSDYLFIPVGVDKLFAEKHHLLGGIAGAYLLNSYEELTEKRTENGISQTRNYRSSGYKSGLQTYDIQLFAGYALQKARLRFSLGYYFGLTDTGRNAIIRSKRFERNKGVQVSIGYLF